MPLATTATGTLRPQYAFRQRRDRQRIAMRIAAGMDPGTIAGVGRSEPETMRQLLGEASFAKLVLHYEELARLDPSGRRARILAMAVEVIQLAVLASNTAVANLVLHEELMGRRDPAERIALAVVERALRKAHLARGPLSQPRQPRAGPPSFRTPEPLAATEPDAEAAARLAVAERAKSLPSGGP